MGGMKGGIRSGGRVCCFRSLLGLGRCRGRGRRRERKQHLIDLIHGQLTISVYGVGHCCIRHSSCYIHLIPCRGHIQLVRALAATGLGAHWVAGGLELRGGEVGGEDVELHQFDLLLIAEGVQCAWFQVREGAVGGGEDSEALV